MPETSSISGTADWLDFRATADDWDRASPGSLGAMLAMARRLVPAHASLTSGRWERLKEVAEAYAFVVTQIGEGKR